MKRRLGGIHLGLPLDQTIVFLLLNKKKKSGY